MALDRYSYPFTAIVGQDEMKLALVLNAINPTIGGVLIRGEKGTGKSTAVRALARLLPEQQVVEGCHFGCHPDDPEDWCADCRARSIGGALPVATRRMRVVELPINASEDRVVGTIDLEAALKEGSRRFEPGVLAEANRNILYVDEVNLLDDHIVDVLLDAAAMGVNTVEREGVSVSHPSRFILVGTMNPEEGEPRPPTTARKRSVCRMSARWRRWCSRTACTPSRSARADRTSARSSPAWSAISRDAAARMPGLTVQG